MEGWKFLPSETRPKSLRSTRDGALWFEAQPDVLTFTLTLLDNPPGRDRAPTPIRTTGLLRAAKFVKFEARARLDYNGSV